MTDEHEQEIREKAYALWEKEGSPHGRDVEFWERARGLIEADPAPASAAPAPSPADREVDVAMEETFPASDPPSFTADRGPLSR